MKPYALGGTAALLAALSLGACDARTLASLAGAALADGANARPSAPPSLAPPSAAPETSSSPTPTAAPSAPAGPNVASADLDAIAYLKAEVQAKEQDPVAMAKLVVQAMCYATRNPAVATDMLAYLSDRTLADPNETSAMGYRLRTNYLTFLESMLEKEPFHGYFYTRSGFSLTADWKTVADNVIIDEDYKAVQKGVEGKEAYYYFKVRDGIRTSAKLILSQGKSDAGPNAWRANNLSSLYVTYGFPLPE